MQSLISVAATAGGSHVFFLSAGDELVMLAQRLPNHTFLGVDLAEGMIEVAREVTAAAGLR